jgi:hypothetical protein
MYLILSWLTTVKSEFALLVKRLSSAKGAAAAPATRRRSEEAWKCMMDVRVGKQKIVVKL